MMFTARGGLVIVNGQVAVLLANSVWVVVRDFLRQQPDLCARITLKVVLVNVLPVVGLADLLDVFFQTLVGEGK